VIFCSQGHGTVLGVAETHVWTFVRRGACLLSTSVVIGWPRLAGCRRLDDVSVTGPAYQ
jgi:hypothetical protein